MHLCYIIFPVACSASVIDLITNDNICYWKALAEMKKAKCQDRTEYVSVLYDNLCWSVGGGGLWTHELEQYGLRSGLIRWGTQAVTGRCILGLISARGKAEVCSGMKRFNILQPNYTCPCIALYASIESTESAYESLLFSWVNKKSSLARHNIFQILLFFEHSELFVHFKDKSLFFNQIYFNQCILNEEFIWKNR